MPRGFQDILLTEMGFRNKQRWENAPPPFKNPLVK